MSVRLCAAGLVLAVCGWATMEAWGQVTGGMRVVGESATGPASAPAKKPVEKADVAVPRGGVEKPDVRWMARHAGYKVLAAKGGIDLYFLGDSITEGWRGAGKLVWAENFSGWKPANFGIGGDRTQHVLWRLQNGEFENVKPKVLVLMIGTNNTGSNSAEEIASGVRVIVEEIQKQSPETKILLLGIFPRSADAGAPIRRKIQDINEIIAKLGNGKTVKYLDIGAKFLKEDGTLTKDVMPDLLHLSEEGYRIWAAAIKPVLTEWLGEPAATAPAK